MLKYKLLLVIFFIGTTCCSAQFTNILIDSVGDPEEPSIAINPNNTNELVAGSNIDNQYYSHDGGLTWTKQTLTSTWGVWGDPCIIADSAGRFYFFHLSYTSTPSGWIDRVICQRSDDAGVTWPVESFTGLNGTKDQDKAWAVYDGIPQSIYKGNLYVTWTEFDEYANTSPSYRSRIMFSKSIDNGVTWNTPITISQFTGDCLDEDNTTEGAVPALGPNGELYVSWSLNDTIYFDRSTDGGQTWLTNDIVCAAQPTGWDYSISGIYRANGLPVTATDLSNGSYNGTIYVNWSDQRNGAFDTDIWLSKSTDGGNTWSLPLRVNNDAAGNQNFFTWMTVDQTTGWVYIVFYDRRNYIGSDQTDVYLAYSNDGGATFNNIKISDSPFTPDAAAFFGDYTNITAHNGHIRPIWARMDSISSSVWTALIDFSVGINSDDYFGLNASLRNFPNPFAHKTSINFSIPQNQKLTLKIIDVTGKEVKSLFENTEFAKGSHSTTFDNAINPLAAGIYFLKLSGKNHSEACKIIVSE